MAIIYSYPLVAPELTDLIVGTKTNAQGSDNPTKSFTIGDLSGLIRENIEDITLTTTGPYGDATLVDRVLNIPTYVAPAVAFQSLETNGTSGAATLNNGVLNIPVYTGNLGTVTSVGLSSSVNAFSVSNNPVTTAGTLSINLKGGSAGQFLRQDGNWATVQDPDLTVYQLKSEKGNANGYTPLDANNKVPTIHLPAAIVGSVIYRGTWDAAANTPFLPDPTTVKGDYYVVSNPGAYLGITYALGDWVISNGANWEKVDNSAGVNSVNGATGTVSLGLADLNDVTSGTTTGDVLTVNEDGEYDFQTPAFQDIVSTCLGEGVVELNSTTNVFMVFDTTSGLFANSSNRTQLQGYAQEWMNDYTANNPGYAGQLFMAIAGESWLSYPSYIYDNTSLSWLGSTPSVAQRKDMFLVAFVNETNAEYHNSNGQSLLQFQPTTPYISSYNSFKQDTDPDADRITFFKGIVYPVTQVDTVDEQAQFVLHAYAAIEGCDSGTIDLANLRATTGPNYYVHTDASGNPNGWDATITDGVTVNPYNELYSDMKTSGWSTILNKRQTDSTSIPFDVATFNNDLNSTLEGASTSVPGEDKVQVLKSFENGVITLRGLKSSTLDLSVDDEGCIVIELRE